MCVRCEYGTRRGRFWPSWGGTDDIFPYSAVEAPALPQGRHNEAAYFLSCILEGTPPAGMVRPQVCCDVQEVLEAGARAITEQRVVPLPLA